MTKKWLDEEIIEAYESSDSVWLAGEQLGWPGQKVHNHLRKIGYVLNTNRYTEKEKDIIVAYYDSRSSFPKGTFNLDELANSLGREKTNIARYARQLGLTNATRKCSPELIALQAERTREWMAVNQHPRGMLGKKHSQKVCNDMSIRTISYWDNITPEQLEVRRVKTNNTKCKNGNYVPVGAGYSLGKVGKRQDLQGMYFRSRWEANYARILTYRKNDPMDPLEDWFYEPDRFDFFQQPKGTPSSYLPDFKVVEACAQPYYVEIKGWMDQKSRDRLRLMKRMYPDVYVLVIGASEYRELEQTWKDRLDIWEVSK